MTTEFFFFLHHVPPDLHDIVVVDFRFHIDDSTAVFVRMFFAVFLPGCKFIINYTVGLYTFRTNTDTVIYLATYQSRYRGMLNRFADEIRTDIE